MGRLRRSGRDWQLRGWCFKETFLDTNLHLVYRDTLDKSPRGMRHKWPGDRGLRRRVAAALFSFGIGLYLLARPALSVDHSSSFD